MSADAGVPGFLVVGAQKSGTTTLWEDLRTHPDLAVSDKESNGLLDPEVTTPAGRRRYSALFGPPRVGALTGEVCTTYTMLPTHPGVTERAVHLNPDVRVVYILRDPVDRVISHHHHDLALRLCDADVDVAVRTHPPLVDNTRYATQLRPWVEALGPERVLVVRFEDYVVDRGAGLARVQDFLGIRQVPLVEVEVHNAHADRRVAVGVWERLSSSAAYRSLVRPLLGERVRRTLVRTVLPTGPERPDPPSPETVDHLVETLAPEVSALAALTGQPPLWDLEESRRRHGGGQ